jgi:hypothetical protein
VALVALAVVVGVLAGRLGRRSRHESPPQVRWWAVLVVAVVAQVIASRIDSTPALVVLLTAEITVVVVAVANLHIAGAGVLALGVALNVAVTAANAGMPVHPRALVAADLATPAEIHAIALSGHRHVERPSDVLTILDDRIPIRALGLVVSFGDLVVAAGTAAAVAGITRRRRRAQPSATASPVQDWGTAPYPAPESASQYSAQADVRAPSTVGAATSGTTRDNR